MPEALTNSTSQAPSAAAGIWNLISSGVFDVMLAAWPHTRTSVVAVMSQAPDAVISDYRLRAGRTGVEVLEAIRGEFGASIPGLVLTGDTSLPTLRRIGAEKAFRVLYKPVSAEALAQELQRLLG